MNELSNKFNRLTLIFLTKELICALIIKHSKKQIGRVDFGSPFNDSKKALFYFFIFLFIFKDGMKSSTKIVIYATKKNLSGISRKHIKNASTDDERFLSLGGSLYIYLSHKYENININEFFYI